MEKLQAALAKAREKRSSSGRFHRAKIGGGTARAVTRAEDVADLWEALPIFEPSENRLKASRIFSNEVSSDAQHFDILRTKLMLEMRRNDWKRIAVTSATPACGKTTTACNLIAGMGRQPENCGILFDMDFRRPAVSKLFGASPTSSLEDVLTGNVDFSDHAMRLHPNAAISMTTRPISDPAQIVLSSQTADILDQIQMDYQPDLMLFDMPPVLVSDESRGFLKLVDAAVIVAGAENSTVSQVDEVEREVAQYSNVAGVILNKCRFLDEGYGYTY